MQTIVLDYSDWKVYTLNHDNLQIEEVEDLLTTKHNFRLDEIEWMTVEKLSISEL